MASRIPVECPLCHHELVDEQLESHLKRTHSKDELIKEIISSYEDLQEGSSLG